MPNENSPPQDCDAKNGADESVGTDDAPLIEARAISKRFGAVQALNDVNMEFCRGQVHGLIGANGAGKSTLLNILAGAVTPTSGSVLVDGTDMAISTPREADRLGFSFIHQELALIPDFSAIDNITLGLSATSRFGLTDLQQRVRVTETVAERLGLAFDLSKPVRQLSAADRGLVAIGRALARETRFIAMDEPTASLSDVECNRLFGIVRDLAAHGVSVAYVSHRLNEIEDLSDHVTVFREGRITGRFARGGFSRVDLIAGITGEDTELGTRDNPPTVPDGAPKLFSADHLADGERVADVSFDVRAGEIVGLAGVVGAGRSEVLRMVFGDHHAISGDMHIDGRPHRPRNVREAIRRGVALVPEERRSQGLVMDNSIRSNITLGNWKQMQVARPSGLVSDTKAETVAKRMLDALSIKARSTATSVRKLSGGNQQKVVFARWLGRDARLLLLDEPTRGVDIGSRQQIWETVEQFAAAGNAVVVVSSELEEMSICHRIFVMVEGRTVEELIGPGLTEEQMLSVVYRHDHDLKEQTA